MLHRLITPLLLMMLLAACETDRPGDQPIGITADRHVWFSIGDGTSHALGAAALSGTIGCTSCHAETNTSFKQFDCVGCHEHAAEVTDRLHAGVGGYAFTSEACYSCHPTGGPLPFSHAGITDGCASCHDVGMPNAALPKDGFTHPDMHGADCGTCHLTTSWKGAGEAPINAFDPANDLTLDAQVPTWLGTSITSLAPRSQTLHMKMNHATTQLPAAAMSACTNCHAEAAQGRYFPGALHASLNDLNLAPSGCSDCHDTAMPVGFVGPYASPKMRHDAVAWSTGAPGSTPLVPKDCGLCHLPPTLDVASTWSTDKADAGTPAQFHAPLGGAQPSECLDCHAATRPTAPVTLASGSAFDHQSGAALGECSTCHRSTSTWSGGAFHAAGAPLPTTCLPCHEAERPTTTSGWLSTTYSRSPFDYVTNLKGITHGAGQDCVVCHARTQDWSGGNFVHGPGTLSATRCVSCHSTQRPDLLPGATASTMASMLGFDHAVNGSGDCLGCHQATVTGGRYVNLYRAGAAQTVANLRGGDWDGGIAYPGSFTSSTDQSITVTELTLQRSGSGLVTGISSVPTTYYNGMLHTSTMLQPPNVPTALSPGPIGSPVYTACWHCHTNTNGTVTAYSNGNYHASLDNYRATPGGTLAPVAQPTKQCTDCHATMLPAKLVQKGTTNLQPMDHAAQFTGTVNIGGASVSRVSQLDCSVCHKSPGGSWADGTFHARIGAAVPADCVSCHYPLMADAAKADVSSLPKFKMQHRSAQVTVQKCETCHVGALARSTGTVAATLWRETSGPATYHPHVSTQPAACVDCHSVSQPAGATAGAVLYGPMNQYQWMNHASPQLAGKECAVCHLNDARSTPLAWNRAAKFHGPVAAATSCRECHGLTNGMGTTPGTNNNMPPGLVTTATVTTASASTGVAGVRDQISHADVNVTANDCKVCHTQQGASTVAAVQGKEWAQASFHRNFTGSTQLVLNGTTGRCSHCHLNVKPGSGYTAQDHSAFNGTTGQDCSACHAYNPASVNWRGATGAHASSGSTSASTLDCNTCHGLGGSSSTHLSVAASSHYGGVANGNTCKSCHVDFTAFKGTVAVLKYAHTNATANLNGCGTCHVFKSSIYTTLTTTPPLNRAISGQPHQFSQTLSVTGSFNGRTFTSAHTDTKMVRCGSCHQYSTTTSTTNVWQFKHRPSNPGISNSKSTSGCNQCH